MTIASTSDLRCKFSVLDEMIEDGSVHADDFLAQLIEASSDSMFELALLLHLREDGEDDILVGDIEAAPYDGDILRVSDREYLVVDDGTADILWDDSLENYLDECVLSELEGIAAQYFDREAWKRDARHDGRGHSLSGYDGNECEAGQWCIFRQN